MSTAAKPRNRNAWIWTIVKGLVALALGIYLLVSAQTAPLAAAYALAGYVALNGIIQTITALFNRGGAGSVTGRLRGPVGLVGGLALLLLTYFDVLSLAAIYAVLAVLLIIYGALGLFGAVFDRGGARFQWMPVLVNFVLLALGVLVIYSRFREFDLRLWSGVVLAVLGLLLIGFGYLIQKPNPSALAANV